MADSNTDDFEPLFDYRRVQPVNFISIDDDSSDASPVRSPKRTKISDPEVVKIDDEVEVIKVVNEEEDWLALPPTVSTDAYSKIGEDSTIKELRLRKQELVSFAQSTKTMLLEVEESVKRKLSGSVKPSLDAAAEQPKAHCSERAKIVIAFQKADERKQFRAYVMSEKKLPWGKKTIYHGININTKSPVKSHDDKFERLFSLYADKTKLDLKCLVFSFDGDKISPAATPASLGMEDEDIIEVHVKKS